MATSHKAAPDWAGSLVKVASRIIFLGALITVLLLDLFVWRPN